MKKLITLILVIIFGVVNLEAQKKVQRQKNVQEGKPVIVQEGKPVNVQEGKPVNVQEGQPVIEAKDSSLVPVPMETQPMMPPQGIIDSSEIIIPILEDKDGNTYGTAQLGKQIWMTQNLRTTLFKDGSPIPLVTDKSAWIVLKDPAYCWYSNNADSKEFYGALYNWNTVKTGMLCPSGWHIPTDAEWTELEIYLQNNDYNYDGTVDADLDRETKNKIAKALASEVHWAESTNKGSMMTKITIVHY